jgi:predicted Rossmann-fold nucleotide-binding protein
MDELFETLTLIQTRKIPRIPVVLFGSEYWQEIINWQAFVRRGLISPEDLGLFHLADTAVDGWNHIRQFYGEATVQQATAG